MKSLAEARIKRTRAVELASEGMSYDMIAKAVGYAHRGSAHKAVMKALALQEVANVEELRAVELDRLDGLLRAVWPRVEDGDLDAINTALRISQARTKLLGLALRRGDSNEFAALVVAGRTVF